MAKGDETKTDTPQQGEEATEAADTPTVDEQAVENVVEEVVNAATSASPSKGTPTTASGKKKRLCRYPGCTKVIKSQGHCQRHGARAKRCKVEGCEKQAQGTHEGMCKRHWKAVHCPAPPPKPEQIPPPPEGESVYDSILPASLSYRPPSNNVLKAIKSEEKKQSKDAAKKDEDDTEPADAVNGGDEANPEDTSPVAAMGVMPLVRFLKEGQSKEPGWHRQEERKARGAFPVAASSTQLETWERQLALFEVFLLSGGVGQANFGDLAYAWGREKGFHQLLVQSVCERRGEVERKKRSDAGRTMTAEERQSFRSKLKKARLTTQDDEAPSTPVAVAATPEGAAASAEAGKDAEPATGDAIDAAPEELKPASVEEMVESVSV